MKKIGILIISCLLGLSFSYGQGTRLLRQPDISKNNIVFTYGSDIWISSINGGKATRITSTPAVESNPTFSPDGKWIAFSSNRSGGNSVYIVSIDGGTPKRLTWHPSSSNVRGWTPDGKHVLFASTRETAPNGYNRLWTVSVEGGPASLLNKQWGADGSFSKDGKQIVVDRVSRWDGEWRAYRGGQNTPLVVLDLESNEEQLFPNQKTTDIKPLWLDDTIYFLSDRDYVANIWSFKPTSNELKQITTYTGSDIKSVAGIDKMLIFERDGYLHLLDLNNNSTKQLWIEAKGDFPWAETKWEDVSDIARSVSISATGKRAIMESRGEIFTVPVEFGDVRNLTKSNNAADRSPIWSPKGDKVAWFSDAGGKAYSLMIADQDGLSKPKSISIGESKLGWSPAWSPDGKHIAFVDDDVRVRVLTIASGTVKTVDTGNTNMERGRMGLTWSPDSKWLAYSKSATNSFRQITVWSMNSGTSTSLTNNFADSFSPSWDRDGRHLYFLSSTDLALRSGWANTSSITAQPEYSAYVMNLRKDDKSPFVPKSDEESTPKKEEPSKEKKSPKNKKKKESGKKEDKEKKDVFVKIDFDGIDRRIIPLTIPERNYAFTVSGPKGVVFVAERIPNSRGLTIHKYNLEKREAKEFISGAGGVSVSADGKKMLARVNGSWKVIDAGGPNGKNGKSVKVNLKVKLDRSVEWAQMFEDAWRYERDYFYDPNMHGRDWNLVHERYAPLIPFVKHRADLTYVLDQMNGELSVGHSFVFGGDYPDTERSYVGLLGADLVEENGYWRVKRIFTTESWNPGLSSPLDRPELKVTAGTYIVGVNGVELKGSENPYKLFDGTMGVQTTLHVNSKPSFEGSRKIIVEPIRSENALRQRAWVEDNRRLVDKLSNGKLAYVWVPNTSTPGFVSFNRYYFAQQDKQGAIIDERFNGGGLLDDYMVDLMTRSLRAALTNEVPNPKSMRLPAGILGPKVLLINEMAGSGGDFFPWVFRQQKAGPLIGSTTWGGLVKSSVHYGLVDGGALTAPDNAVFDPINNKWIAENEGVTPDIAVRQDAKSLAEDRDPQLERAVKEALRLLQEQGEIKVSPPPFSTPVKKN
ncbi:S41 family peptidase [Spongiivirga citrea]|uniref:Tricorn protease homolog n=1 Tax=Spongiivirga citrea TaxID=1481457 RepID=A0A6M0CSH3_9FLAO|nr:S41 family peptidase [Spongiivirga citrea]NER18859.1 protease [Spongiivirga citrea]